MVFGYLQTLLFGSNDDESLGNAGAVLEAIHERSSFDFNYVGTFGEPDIVDRGGNYDSDLYVVVPLYTDPDDPTPANLEYPLPDGVEETSAEFFDVLDRFGIDDLTALDEISGKNVPLDFDEGTLVPLWDELTETTTGE